MAAQSKEALLPSWGLAVAGSTGAVLANALVYPLDIVKTRLQVQHKRHPAAVDEADDDAAATTTRSARHYHGTLHAIQSIVADEGLAGLYSGMAGGLIGVASTNFAYFYWYSTVRALYVQYQPRHKPSTTVELALGAIAGALAQLFTIPIAVVTTRQQTQAKGEEKGLLATARDVVDSDDGWTGLWRGLKASLVLVVNPAITYGAYQRLRDLLYPNKTNLRPHEAFLLGALSKTLATLTTQPLIVAKVGLQSRPPPSRNGRHFTSFGEVIKHIVDNEGALGLFKGIAPQILKGLLVQGLLMMTKERMELLFIVLFVRLRQLRRERLDKVAAAVKVQAMHVVRPLTT